MKISDLRKKRLLLLSISSGLIIISGIIFGILPLFSKIVNLNSEVDEKRVQLAIFQQERTNLEQTQVDYAKISNDISKISKIFIDSGNALDVFYTLEDVAALNLVSQDIKVNSGSSGSNTTLNMDITLDCTWIQCLSYINDTEKLNFYLRIDNLRFTSKGDLLHVTFSANTYGNK
ncbi:hypothetical protein IID19_03000 [Patescibacteria group bacterium]|nr:hypothetical protein [Patescibacteria group bacterium]